MAELLHPVAQLKLRHFDLKCIFDAETREVEEENRQGNFSIRELAGNHRLSHPFVEHAYRHMSRRYRRTASIAGFTFHATVKARC